MSCSSTLACSSFTRLCSSSIAFNAAASSAFNAIVCEVTSFCFVSLAVSNCISSAFNLASSSKSSLVDADNEFSNCLASNLNLDAAISLFVISSSILPASSKKPILSSTENFSLFTAFSNKSALVLSAFALCTCKSLSALSALALISDNSPAIAISLRVSSPKFLIPSVTLAIDSAASSKLPVTKDNIALPKFPNISVTFPITTVI